MAIALVCGESGVQLLPVALYSSFARLSAFTKATMKASLAAAHLALTTMPSNVGAPRAPMLPEVAMVLPVDLILESTGSQMKVASMSPRSHAAAISGGRMFITFTLRASTPSIFMPAMSW